MFAEAYSGPAPNAAAIERNRWPASPQRALAYGALHWCLHAYDREISREVFRGQAAAPGSRAAEIRKALTVLLEPEARFGVLANPGDQIDAEADVDLAESVLLDELAPDTHRRSPAHMLAELFKAAELPPLFDPRLWVQEPEGQATPATAPPPHARHRQGGTAFSFPPVDPEPIPLHIEANGHSADLSQMLNAAARNGVGTGSLPLSLLRIDSAHPPRHVDIAFDVVGKRQPMDLSSTFFVNAFDANLRPVPLKLRATSVLCRTRLPGGGSAPTLYLRDHGRDAWCAHGAAPLAKAPCEPGRDEVPVMASFEVGG